MGRPFESHHNSNVAIPIFDRISLGSKATSQPTSAAAAATAPAVATADGAVGAAVTAAAAAAAAREQFVKGALWIPFTPWPALYSEEERKGRKLEKATVGR